jgi:hypothetical protein
LREIAASALNRSQQSAAASLDVTIFQIVASLPVGIHGQKAGY